MSPELWAKLTIALFTTVAVALVARDILRWKIGWQAWFRDIDLITPRRLKGKELLMRTRGWWTVEPLEVAEVVETCGRLAVGGNGELLVELEDRNQADQLSSALNERFGDQVFIAP